MDTDRAAYRISRPQHGVDGRFTVGLALDVAAVLAPPRLPTRHLRRRPATPATGPVTLIYQENR